MNQTNNKLASASRRVPWGTILTGDKISTLHGQKGIVKIVPMHELPVIVMPYDE
ncbi:hypothetical protein ABEW05_008663 [Botrytis cinerea]